MAQSDTDLIIQAQRGDAAAFEELVFRYDKRVLAMALKFIDDTEDAKDIYQEVFIRVYRGLKNFKFKSEFSTWLYRITANVCLSFKSRKKKYDHVSISDEYDDEERRGNVSLTAGDMDLPDRMAAENELTEWVIEALEDLPPKQKLTFILKHYEGYKLREIAVMMDCQEGTVKKYLFEAVHRLRRQLEEFRSY